MVYTPVSPITEQRTVIGAGALEKSIAVCEELLASMQNAMHPAAVRTKYLLRVRLAKIRQQLKDIHLGKNNV